MSDKTQRFFFLEWYIKGWYFLTIKVVNLLTYDMTTLLIRSVKYVTDYGWDIFLKWHGDIITASKRSLGQGNIFRSMFQSFCSRGWGGGVVYDVTFCLAAWPHVPSGWVSVFGPMFLPGRSRSGGSLSISVNIRSHSSKRIILNVLHSIFNYYIVFLPAHPIECFKRCK